MLCLLPLSATRPKSHNLVIWKGFYRTQKLIVGAFRMNLRDAPAYAWVSNRSRARDRGHLERNRGIPTLGHDLGDDRDQLLPQACGNRRQLRTLGRCRLGLLASSILSVTSGRS